MPFAAVTFGHVSGDKRGADGCDLVGRVRVPVCRLSFVAADVAVFFCL